MNKFNNPSNRANPAPSALEQSLAVAIDSTEVTGAAIQELSILAKDPAFVASLRAHVEVGDALRSLEPTLAARRVGRRVMQAVAAEPVALAVGRSRREQAAQARAMLRWGSLAAGVAAVAFLTVSVAELSPTGPSQVATEPSSNVVQVSLSAPDARRYMQAHGNGAAWLRISAEADAQRPASSSSGGR